MILSIQSKQAIVNKINQVAKQSISVIVADYKGITADKMNSFRKFAREIGVHVYVVRNTLISRIFKNTIFEELNNVFLGQNLVVFFNENIGSVVSLFKNFSDDNEFVIKAAFFEKRIIHQSDIDLLMNISTREELIAKLLFLIKEISFGKLIRVFLLCMQKKKIS